MKRIYTLIFILFYYINFGQTAIINVNKVFPNIKEEIKFIKFEINGQKFGEKDSIIKIQINKFGLDKCTAIIEKDTLNFFTKFKENETYIIEQGCCCAAFILEAKNNPNRGIVKFKNKTNRTLGIIIADSNVVEIKKGKTEEVFASESAMCTFKPCSILLTEKKYLDEKYEYNDEKDYQKLQKEQKKFLIASTYFHFLHGEKVEIFYNVKTKKLETKLNGYLTEVEYKKVIEEFNKK